MHPRIGFVDYVIPVQWVTFFPSQRVCVLAFMNSTGNFYTWKWAVRLLAVCVEGRGSESGQMWSWVLGFLGTVVTSTASHFSSGACFCLMFTVPEAFPQCSHPAPAFSCSCATERVSLHDLALPQQ